MFTWEELEKSGPASGSVGQWYYTHRTRLPHGWLVRQIILQREVSQPPGGAADMELAVATSITFVPIGTGKWA
jgi:hypothetical protein